MIPIRVKTRHQADEVGLASPCDLLPRFSGTEGCCLLRVCRLSFPGDKDDDSDSAFLLFRRMLPILLEPGAGAVDLMCPQRVDGPSEATAGET